MSQATDSTTTRAPPAPALFIGFLIEIATCTKTSWIKTWQHSPFGPDPALMRRAAIGFTSVVLFNLSNLLY